MKLLITAGLLIGLLVFVSAPESDSPYSYNLLNPSSTSSSNFTNDSYVPYTGATDDVNLGNNDLYVNDLYAQKIGILNTNGILPIGNDSSTTIGGGILSDNSTGNRIVQFFSFTNLLNFSAVGSHKNYAFVRRADSFGAGSSILRVHPTYADYDGDLYLTDGFLDVSGDITTEGNLTASNICYSNGTNCAASGSSNPFDQSLNTTDNVQFNRTNVIPEFGIKATGYAYGVVGDFIIDPFTTTFYNVFEFSGSSTVDTTASLVPRIFFNGRNFNVHGIGSGTKMLTIHNVPNYNMYNSSNITSLQSYYEGTVFDTKSGSVKIPYYASYISSPTAEVTSGSLEITEFDGYAIGNGESGSSNVLNWFTGAPNISKFDAFEFDTQINYFSANIDIMRGLSIDPTFGIIGPPIFRGIFLGDVTGPGTVESIRSEQSASGNSRAFINHTGTAPSYHTGNFTFGDTQFFTAPNGSIYDCGVSNAGTWSCSHT